jgi:hypothetical protein
MGVKLHHIIQMRPPKDLLLLIVFICQILIAFLSFYQIQLLSLYQKMQQIILNT